MAFAKISLLACLLAAVNAQYSLAPVSPTVAYAPHVTAVSAVPVAHYPVAHAPLPYAHYPVAPVAPVAHYPVAPVAHVAHVAHVPVAHPAYARIISQTQDSSPDGSYTFSYQSEDGISRSESGVPKYPAQPGVESFGGVASQGTYAYTSPEGTPVEVSFTADENGYQPSGPSVHPAIIKAVEEQVAQARAEGPIPPAPVAKVAYPVAHVAVPHYPVAPVAHVAVPHYPVAPVAHVAVPHYPVAHYPVASVAPVAHYPVAAVSHYPVTPTAVPIYGTTIAAKK